MLTAAITAAVAGVLSLFGIQPGSYLMGVAIGVKIVIVLISVFVGSRLMRRRAAAKAAAAGTRPPSP